MKLIVTAGGTRERIDTVRTITNEATGRLGSLIAGDFCARLSGRAHTVYFLYGKGSALPETEDAGLKPIPVESTSDLEDRLLHLLSEEKIDAVVHSMAVSDYRVAAVSSPERAAQRLAVELNARGGPISAAELEPLLLRSLSETAADPGHKISSDLAHPLLLLEKTPKVIHRVKEISPGTLLIGFKLLSGVTRDKLLRVASGLMRSNGCDFVFANDTDSLRTGRHSGYLLDRTGKWDELTGKPAIAAGIAARVLRALAEAEK